MSKMPVENVVVDRVSAPPMIPGSGALGGIFDKVSSGLNSAIRVGFPNFQGPKGDDNARDFLKTERGEFLIGHFERGINRDRAEDGKPPIKLTEDQKIAILKYEQDSQMKGKPKDFDSMAAFERVVREELASVKPAVVSPAATAAAQQMQTGLDFKDPRHYGSGAAGKARVDAGLKSAGVS